MYTFPQLTSERYRARAMCCHTRATLGPHAGKPNAVPTNDGKDHLPKMALALAYKAFPCAVLPFTAQNPVIPNSLRACFTASQNFFNGLDAYLFFACADRNLDTTLPLLFMMRVSFVKPPTVLAFFFLTFVAFMAAAAFMAFIPFIAAFMAGLRAA